MKVDIDGAAQPGDRVLFVRPTAGRQNGGPGPGRRSNGANLVPLGVAVVPRSPGIRSGGYTGTSADRPGSASVVMPVP